MIVFVAPGTGRVTFVAGRRVGGAVARNRAKRVLRAAWREIGAAVSEEQDVAVVARAAIRGARARDLGIELQELLSRVESG